MREWKEVKWGEIAVLEYGKALKDYQNKNGKYPVFGTNGQIGTTDSFLCSSSGIIIGRKGAYRGVHYSDMPFFVIDTAFYLNPAINELNIKFAYYHLLNVDINAMDSGSAIPSTSREEFYDLNILLPELDEQIAISEVLSSLDDKIDLLHRQNKTLEQLAGTLFRQWFEDEAQIDWKEMKLSDFISVKHGYAFKGAHISNEPTNLILVTPGNFKIGGGFKFEKFKYYTDNKFPQDYIFRTGDLIVTMTDLSGDGDTLGYPALIPENCLNENYLHNQRVGKVEFNKDLGKFFIYYLMKTKNYQWFILGGASGTSIRHTSPTTICSYSFFMPPKQKLIEFEFFATELEKKRTKNHTQIRTLTKLRDTLLPKLMSGEVRIQC